MAAIIDMLFQQEVETEKMRKNTRSLVILVSLILTLCSLVMSGMNLLNESWFMLGTTLALAASCFICFLIGLLHYNRMVVECILCVSIISLFSLYVIIGGNAGFAIDWILLVPIAYTALFGLTAGFLMGGYFWVFLILCMWTPINAFLPYVYADEVRLRFPILMPELAVGAKYHHERYDGKGYIYGIAAEEIPIEGRIIGLADAIDAMSSDRVYRGRLSREIMLTELKKGAGKQFDPHLVEIALELIQEGMIE